jgi:hypothetical protein
MSSKHEKYAKHSKKLSRKRLFGIAVASLIVVSLLAVYSFHNQPNNGFKATIIDQLSSMTEFTNATFVKAANNTLNTAGYQVTYYKGSDVNVEFYRRLPQNGYRILVFRVHSALRLNDTKLIAPLDFFTSEPYSDAYMTDQKLGRLDKVTYNVTSDYWYFGIPPKFVTGDMSLWGDFQNATVILMGCNGLDGQLRSQSMLQALVYIGAKVVIGWNASVSMPHTDIATERLLYHLLVENKTVRVAVNETNHEIGPDTPPYKNELLYYPSKSSPFYTAADVGNYTIAHGSSKSAATKVVDYILPSSNEGVLAMPLLLSVTGLDAFGKFRRKTSSVFQSVSIQ